MPAPTSTSFIDRVNDADEPIGRVRRGEVFALGAGFRVAHVLVLNRSGDVLLQQVGRTRERSALQWGSSVAAYLHSGETYVDAAARRLLEELGADAALERLGATSMLDHGARKFISVFSTRVDHPTIVDPVHIENIRFWPVHEIDEVLATDPRRFTETFPYVWSVYKARQPQQAP